MSVVFNVFSFGRGVEATCFGLKNICYLFCKNRLCAHNFSHKSDVHDNFFSFQRSTLQDLLPALERKRQNKDLMLESEWF